MATTDIAKRMRRYEEPFNQTLPQRMPVLIRVDGKAFHTFCRKFQKPWDSVMRRAMDAAAIAICEEAQGACCAYLQSDEITILLVSYRRFNSQPWLGNRVSKMVSIAASIATRAFNQYFEDQSFAEPYCGARGCFDARVFVVPREDVTNAFVERQQDAIRNSVQMLAQVHFPHKQLQGKSVDDQEAMLEDKKIFWSDSQPWEKWGRFITREVYDHGDGTKRSRWVVNDAPLFVQERHQIDRFVWPVDEQGADDTNRKFLDLAESWADRARELAPGDGSDPDPGSHYTDLDIYAERSGIYMDCATELNQMVRGLPDIILENSDGTKTVHRPAPPGGDVYPGGPIIGEAKFVLTKKAKPDEVIKVVFTDEQELANRHFKGEADAQEFVGFEVRYQHGIDYDDRPMVREGKVIGVSDGHTLVHWKEGAAPDFIPVDQIESVLPKKRRVDNYDVTEATFLDCQCAICLDDEDALIPDACHGCVCAGPNADIEGDRRCNHCARSPFPDPTDGGGPLFDQYLRRS